jgi:hypothetical protein
MFSLIEVGEISGFCSDAAENCTLLGCYAANSRNYSLRNNPEECSSEEGERFSCGKVCNII